MSSTSLKFGTSGLRGIVTELNGVPAFAYTRAFAEMLKENGAAAQGSVLIGRDLRDSSPAIVQLCCAALRESGLTPVDCGALPTPALAYHGSRFSLPAIMVTGSHIPDDRNGLKFYQAEGEIDKHDESRILSWHDRLDIRALPKTTPPPSAAAPEFDPIAAYAARYCDFFGPGALSSLIVGVYQHSSVARDLMVEILEALGAQVVPLGWATRFVPVDTEALREEDVVLVRQWASEQRIDAIVSTDGDADRPLMADHAGSFLRGDLVGAITARSLGVERIVTPVTSNSMLEACGAFAHVIRTMVGSPYVIASMAEAACSSSRGLVGFEANGGVLLGTCVTRGERTLAALPTRDAMLPILCILAEMRAQGRPLTQIAAEFAFRAAASNCLLHVPADKSAAFLSRLENDEAFLSHVLAPLGGGASQDTRDGLRLTSHNGEVVHFRPSGNAPELRVYVEAASSERAEILLRWGLDVARRHMDSLT